MTHTQRERGWIHKQKTIKKCFWEKCESLVAGKMKQKLFSYNDEVL